MASFDEQRNEELATMERERQAFERRHAAWLAVHRQFKPFGNGVPDEGSMKEFDQAEKEWKAAVAEMDRIAQEIRTGKRK